MLVTTSPDVELRYTCILSSVVPLLVDNCGGAKRSSKKSADVAAATSRRSALRGGGCTSNYLLIGYEV